MDFHPAVTVLIKSGNRTHHCDNWRGSGITEWESVGVVCVEPGVDVPPSLDSKLHVLWCRLSCLALLGSRILPGIHPMML